MACESYGVVIDHDFNKAITLERATEYLVLTSLGSLRVLSLELTPGECRVDRSGALFGRRDTLKQANSSRGQYVYVLSSSV
ncbi:hypothetical protein [Sulfobacillus thermosulfidooxidans]|uniref:hypothetical protein n=1 Tax=Sulfobacillus thermosulfidooxidans TaxID=28034 RepID=UPI0003816302|nr:hypothetical protein [Sulfobacillus thermosulfidooxidans]